LAGLTRAAGAVQGGIFLLEAADAPLAQFLVTPDIKLRELLVPQDIEAQEQDAQGDDGKGQKKDFQKMKSGLMGS